MASTALEQIISALSDEISFPWDRMIHRLGVSLPLILFISVLTKSLTSPISCIVPTEFNRQQEYFSSTCYHSNWYVNNTDKTGNNYTVDGGKLVHVSWFHRLDSLYICLGWFLLQSAIHLFLHMWYTSLTRSSLGPILEAAVKSQSLEENEQQQNEFMMDGLKIKCHMIMKKKKLISRAKLFAKQNIHFNEEDQSQTVNEDESQSVNEDQSQPQSEQQSPSTIRTADEVKYSQQHFLRLQIFHCVRSGIHAINIIFSSIWIHHFRLNSVLCKSKINGFEHILRCSLPIFHLLRLMIVFGIASSLISVIIYLITLTWLSFRCFFTKGLKKAKFELQSYDEDNFDLKQYWDKQINEDKLQTLSKDSLLLLALIKKNISTSWSHFILIAALENNQEAQETASLRWEPKEKRLNLDGNSENFSLYEPLQDNGKVIIHSGPFCLWKGLNNDCIAGEQFRKWVINYVVTNWNKYFIQAEKDHGEEIAKNANTYELHMLTSDNFKDNELDAASKAFEKNIVLLEATPTSTPIVFYGKSNETKLDVWLYLTVDGDYNLLRLTQQQQQQQQQQVDADMINYKFKFATPSNEDKSKRRNKESDWKNKKTEPITNNIVAHDGSSIFYGNGNCNWDKNFHHDKFDQGARARFTSSQADADNVSLSQGREEEEVFTSDTATATATVPKVPKVS
jgi:hypothetical protein